MHTATSRPGVALRLAAFIAFGLAAVPIVAQQRAAESPRALTAADYARAEKFMTYNVTPLVLRSGVRPTWLPDDRFWYRVPTEAGAEFLLVDSVRGTRAPAFDHVKLAEALSAAAGAKFDGSRLPFQQMDMSADGKTITVSAARRRWTCDVDGSRCVAAPGAPDPEPSGRGGGRGGAAAAAPDIPSPDGKQVAFVRNHNLWVRDISTRKETQLTTDGIKDFAYATNNAGWTKSERPILLWSPDSKKIATFQHDQRLVGDMYLVDTRVGHPQLQAWKYPLPGDEHIITIQRVIIDVERATVVRLQMPADPHRSTLCDHVICRGGDWADVHWSPDSTRIAFVSTSRDHRHEQLRIADAATGSVRDVLEEKVATFFESGNGRVNWRVLFESNEVIWSSERDNWGQLYLYDLQTGKLKHQITKGEGNVTQLLRIDEKARMLYFLGVGREKGRDPYFTHFYRIGMDGANQQLLTPENANHEIALSDSGRYFVDSYSTPEKPPVALLRDAEGREKLTLERADISKLLAAGWTAPMPFTVKARDGVTDIYGLLYRPTNFSESAKYPIVNSIYPGPQSGSVGSRSFSPARGDTRSLAELGFIVVQIDGMGTPGRSKKFHEAYYANMGDNTLPDQIAGMRQLAQRYSWIDIERAGIYGHSGGGYATAAAMLRHPDFFKVGVSQAGNHDNRNYEDDWGEKWQGLLERKSDGTTNYDDQANQTHAKNLKGKLLLAHGTLDSNVPPYNTLNVVNELIKANKDFDFILFPNRSHGFGSEPYMVRRRWDYFVRYLMGAEPPKEYELKPPAGEGRPGT
jgi:dipeptidyl aminopeptidase/acylaminoacyl peptidase